MKPFELTDPFGTAPDKGPFLQSVSRGVPWHNLPVTREYTLGQLLDQTIARCGENDAVVYSDRDFRLTWYEFGEEVDRLARGLMAMGVKRGEKIALWATNLYWGLFRVLWPACAFVADGESVVQRGTRMKPKWCPTSTNFQVTLPVHRHPEAR